MKLTKTVRSMTEHPSSLFALISLAFLMIDSPDASASVATIDLSGSGTLAINTQFLGSPTGNVTGPGGTSAIDALLVPGTYSFSDAFAAPQTFSLTGTSGLGSYSFQDSYKFTIAKPADGSTVTAAINDAGLLNVSNLQFRLYEAASPTAAATVGAVPGTATSILLWTAASSSSFSNIAPGTYFLDIAGTANGSAGGTYGGALTLQTSAVPLPGSLSLAAGGLVLLGLAGRRRAR